MYVHQIVKGAFLFLINEKQILLYKRKDTTHFQNYYGVVSGNVEENEIFESAIIREAEEETGIKIKQNDLKAVHVMHRIDEQDESMYVFFLAEKWEGEIENKEPNRCEELIWATIEELPENIVPYVKDAIESYTKQIHFSEYKWQ
jgi:ADP-ribose pyrophosphatase YjhB (NUDIX family)